MYQNRIIITGRHNRGTHSTGSVCVKGVFCDSPIQILALSKPCTSPSSRSSPAGRFIIIIATVGRKEDDDVPNASKPDILGLPIVAYVTFRLDLLRSWAIARELGRFFFSPVSPLSSDLPTGVDDGSSSTPFFCN